LEELPSVIITPTRSTPCYEINESKNTVSLRSTEKQTDAPTVSSIYHPLKIKRSALHKFFSPKGDVFAHVRM